VTLDLDTPQYSRETVKLWKYVRIQTLLPNINQLHPVKLKLMGQVCLQVQTLHLVTCLVVCGNSQLLTLRCFNLWCSCVVFFFLFLSSSSSSFTLSLSLSFLYLRRLRSWSLTCFSLFVLLSLDLASFILLHLNVKRDKVIYLVWKGDPGFRYLHNIPEKQSNSENT